MVSVISLRLSTIRNLAGILALLAVVIPAAPLIAQNEGFSTSLLDGREVFGEGRPAFLLDAAIGRTSTRPAIKQADGISGTGIDGSLYIRFENSLALHLPFSYSSMGDLNSRTFASSGGADESVQERSVSRPGSGSSRSIEPRLGKMWITLPGDPSYYFSYIGFRFANAGWQPERGYSSNIGELQQLGLCPEENCEQYNQDWRVKPASYDMDEFDVILGMEAVILSWLANDSWLGAIIGIGAGVAFTEIQECYADPCLRTETDEYAGLFASGKLGIRFQKNYWYLQLHIEGEISTGTDRDDKYLATDADVDSYAASRTGIYITTGFYL